MQIQQYVWLNCRFQAKVDPQRDANLPMSTAMASAAGLLAPFLLDVDSALAGNPLLTGKTVSLIHPAIMIFLFGSTAWTGWLGWQWRSVHFLCFLHLFRYVTFVSAAL